MAQPSQGQPNHRKEAAAAAGGLLVVRRAVEANAAARQALVDTLVANVRSILVGFHGWYDDAAVRLMSTQVGGLVQSAQRVMASQEDAFLAHIAADMTGRTVRPVGQIAVADLRKGVDPEQVYERLAVQFRYEVSKGETPEKALHDVLNRADVMNQTDVALAAREQAKKNVVEMPRVTGYRRVVHPELSKGGACGLCIAASDRIYHKKALLPIHARCKCEVLPIIGENDPGSSLNNLDLGDLYDDAGSTSGADLKRPRYQFDENGELGPMLAPKGAKKPDYIAA